MTHFYLIETKQPDFIELQLFISQIKLFQNFEFMGNFKILAFCSNSEHFFSKMSKFPMEQKFQFLPSSSTGQ